MSYPIVHPEIEKYLYAMEERVERPAILKMLEQVARVKKFPIIGPLVGRTLTSLAVASNAKRVLELGSGFGYSAIWFAQGMAADGTIICTDGDPANRKDALEHFHTANVTQTIDFRTGNALEIARSLSPEFDIVFNDIDKHEYPAVIGEAHRLLRRGGLFITDNALWSGKILEPSVKDKYTIGITQFNEAMFDDTRFFSTILPIRDGVLVAVKK